MPAIGIPYEFEQKAVKFVKNVKYDHKIDIDEMEKRKMDVQSSYLNIIESLRHYSASLLTKQEIQKNIEEFYNDFLTSGNIFEYPNGYNEKTTKAKI